MRPWTLPDVRDVMLAILLYHAGIVAITWWAADTTAERRLAAGAECPAGPIAMRVVDHVKRETRCTYFWTNPK